MYTYFCAYMGNKLRFPRITCSINSLTMYLYYTDLWFTHFDRSDPFVID